MHSIIPLCVFWSRIALFHFSSILFLHRCTTLSKTHLPPYTEFRATGEGIWQGRVPSLLSSTNTHRDHYTNTPITSFVYYEKLSTGGKLSEGVFPQHSLDIEGIMCGLFKNNFLQGSCSKLRVKRVYTCT